MRDVVRASAVQFAPEWLQPKRNAERMAHLVEQEAREHGADLVVFPELSNVGYIHGDSAGLDEEFAKKYVSVAETVPGPTTRTLGEAARACGVHVVLGMAQAPPTIRGVLYNSSVLITPDGSVAGVHHKMHIPRVEKHYFVEGNTAEVFDTKIGKLGMQVCYDDRFPELARVLALKGAEIITAVFAGHSFGGKLISEQFQHRCFTRAQENAVYYIACNRSGVEGEAVYLGHSAIGSPTGELIATSDTSEEDVIRAELLDSKLMDARVFISVFRDRRPEMYGEIVRPLSEPYKSGASLT